MPFSEMFFEFRSDRLNATVCKTLMLKKYFISWKKYFLVWHFIESQLFHNFRVISMFQRMQFIQINAVSLSVMEMLCVRNLKRTQKVHKWSPGCLMLLPENVLRTSQRRRENVFILVSKTSQIRMKWKSRRPIFKTSSRRLPGDVFRSS